MAGLMEYKCPCCGGAIRFDSTLQKMKCPFCDAELEMDALKEMDEELSKVQPDDMTWDSTASGEWKEGEADNFHIYACKSCGGEIVGDATTAATSCPFCGNPVVMSDRLSGMLKPDYVIPFKLDKQAAMEGLKRHLKGKTLLPKVFKQQNHIQEIKGIYVPFWLFDADVEADIHYRASRTRFWRDNRFEYTETKYFSVSRSGNVGFTHVPVDGSTKMADDLMESLEPYDFSEAVDFQTAYLAGYLADKYDVTAKDSIRRANERVKQSTEDVFRSTVHSYDTVETESSSIRLKNGKARYALYPVWLLNTKWHGNQYTFAMNGQTGKFVGNLPVDKGAYWRWFGIFTVIGTVVAYGIANLLFL